MKQVLQDVGNGRLSVAEVPPPVLRDEGILVRSCVSLVSAGTERMLMKLARKSLLGKARARPDLVRKVMAKLRRDGFVATFQAVSDRLEREVPLGYSVCGCVEEAGAKATTFSVGQRVACCGATYANHSELNYVPRLLAARVPDAVSDEAAAYATVGAIALQGIRNAEIQPGEAVVVIGLGLIGQLTVQLLKAAGCRVLGLDPDAQRAELAEANGADVALADLGEPARRANAGFSRGRGADAVIITAATESNSPIELAAQLARDRARVVMVGVAGMDVPRKPYYEKELTLVVSRSYGAGRYDRQYEEHGHDYPAGYVRWTENRNIEAFLDFVAAGSVRPETLTTHRFTIEEATDAFELVFNGTERHLGVVLTYPDRAGERPTDEASRIVLKPKPSPKPMQRVGVSFVGAGSFARSVLLPNLKKLPTVELRGVVSASGISARSAGKKFGFDYCTSTEDEVYGDDETSAVFITTPHSQHARMVCRALASGKAVFVEKPLAIDVAGLEEVAEAVRVHGDRLTVGFNRRFAPMARELKDFFDGHGPLQITYRCNAGPLPEEHWVADAAEGGRIVGEACHFLDFFAFMTGARPQTVFAAAAPGARADDAAVTVTYSDGSVCQLLYTSVGAASFGKERIEVFAGGRAGVIEDFRRLTLQTGTERARHQKRLTADKGHTGELAEFVECVLRGQPMPIDSSSLIETTAVSLAAVRSLRESRPVPAAECCPAGGP